MLSRLTLLVAFTGFLIALAGCDALSSEEIDRRVTSTSNISFSDVLENKEIESVADTADGFEGLSVTKNQLDLAAICDEGEGRGQYILQTARGDVFQRFVVDVDTATTFTGTGCRLRVQGFHRWDDTKLSLFEGRYVEAADSVPNELPIETPDTLMIGLSRINLVDESVGSLTKWRVPIGDLPVQDVNADSL